MARNLFFFFQNSAPAEQAELSHGCPQRSCLELVRDPQSALSAFLPPTEQGDLFVRTNKRPMIRS